MLRNESIKNSIKKSSRLTGDWLWEKAAMCAHIYGGFELPPFISDYKLYNTFKPGPNDQGYYGACFIDVYMDEGKKQVDMIFVHRGTVFDFNNLVDDLRIAMGYAPEVYKVALKYVSDTINLIAKIHGAKSLGLIENTGKLSLEDIYMRNSAALNKFGIFDNNELGMLHYEEKNSDNKSLTV